MSMDILKIKSMDILKFSYIYGHLKNKVALNI